MQRSKELQGLVRVGMVFQSERFLKSTLLISGIMCPRPPLCRHPWVRFCTSFLSLIIWPYKCTC